MRPSGSYCTPSKTLESTSGITDLLNLSLTSDFAFEMADDPFRRGIPPITIITAPIKKAPSQLAMITPTAKITAPSMRIDFPFPLAARLAAMVLCSSVSET